MILKTVIHNNNNNNICAIQNNGVSLTLLLYTFVVFKKTKIIVLSHGWDLTDQNHNVPRPFQLTPVSIFSSRVPYTYVT